MKPKSRTPSRPPRRTQYVVRRCWPNVGRNRPDLDQSLPSWVDVGHKLDDVAPKEITSFGRARPRVGQTRQNCRCLRRSENLHGPRPGTLIEQRRVLYATTHLQSRSASLGPAGGIWRRSPLFSARSSTRVAEEQAQQLPTQHCARLPIWLTTRRRHRPLGFGAPPNAPTRGGATGAPQH